MKKLTSQFISTMLICMALIIYTNSQAQVGINTVTPLETLHVNGNARIDGAIMPNGAAGGVDQMLLSQGTGNSPVWGPGFLNTTDIDLIGKFYVGPIGTNANSLLCGTDYIIDVNDPNMTTTSVVTLNLWSPLPAGFNNGGCSAPSVPSTLFYGKTFTFLAEPRNGVLRIHVSNQSNKRVFNLYFQYVAVYNQ